MVEEIKEQSNIPDGWESQNFSDTIDPLRIDRSKQVQANTYKNEGQYPIVDQGQNLIAGWTDDEKAVFKKELPLIIFGDHTRIFKYVDFPFAVGADGTKLIKPKEYLNPRYFYYRLLHLEVPSKGYSRHYKILKEKAITYPDKPEQKKIAAVLYKIQKAIEVQGKIIESTKALKKTTMQHLFTKGLRGEKTKQTEIGEIPESWEVCRIDDLGDIITGTTPLTANPEYYEGGGYQFIAPNDLGKTTKIYSTEKEISEKGLAVSRVLPAKTICFVCIGSTIGKAGITVAERSATNQQINAIISNKQYDPFFITYLLNYYSDYIAGLSSPNPVPILSKGKFSEIKIATTKDNNEQEEIARIFMSLDNKIEMHELKKRHLQDLFKSLLNKLMTGELRVKDLKIDVSEVGL